MGSSDGCNGRKANRRRIAVSTSAIERSAVFIVPRMRMFFGSENGSVLSEEYSRSIDLSRYSSRKYSSPKILARLPRLISSMMSTYDRFGVFLGLVDQRAQRAGVRVNPTWPPLCP